MTPTVFMYIDERDMKATGLCNQCGLKWKHGQFSGDRSKMSLN